MIKSMTGFGKSSAQAGGKVFSIEIRALNSRQLDLNLRIPSGLRDRENILRNEVAKALERGKADLNIQFREQDVQQQYGIRQELVKERYLILKSLAEELGADKNNLFSVAAGLPDNASQPADELQEEDWTLLLNAVRKALAELDLFRQEEGLGLKTDLIARVNAIVNFMNDLARFEPERITQIRSRLQKRFTEIGAALQVSGNRFEEELIFYLEKLDVSEEKQRLTSHCDYFIECMEEPGNNGRKLSFISQEMGREINTIGSKANHAEMQKLVVLMKDELEKIKEQLNNVL
jgi:uncharacterized protein (TIGR00255 family)